MSTYWWMALAENVRKVTSGLTQTVNIAMTTCLQLVIQDKSIHQMADHVTLVQVSLGHKTNKHHAPLITVDRIRLSIEMALVLLALKVLDRIQEKENVLSIS